MIKIKLEDTRAIQQISFSMQAHTRTMQDFYKEHVANIQDVQEREKEWWEKATKTYNLDQNKLYDLQATKEGLFIVEKEVPKPAQEVQQTKADKLKK